MEGFEAARPSSRDVVSKSVNGSRTAWQESETRFCKGLEDLVADQAAVTGVRVSASFL